MKKQNKKFRGYTFWDNISKNIKTKKTKPATSTPSRQYSDYEIPKYINDPEKPFWGIYPMEYNSILEPEKILWMQGDDEKTLEKNKSRTSSSWKYRTKKVTYTINSSGYRAPEWNQIDWKNSIVLFGCSCTYGIGVSDDETIAYHLEKLSGRPVINLGVGGGSNNLIIQNNINLLELCDTPYAVVNIWTTSDRMNIFSKHGTYNSGPWDTLKSRTRSAFDNIVDVSRLWRLTYTEPYHKVGLTYYNGKVGKYLWKDRSKYSSISFFPDTAYYTDSEKHFVIDNGARDLIHPGEENFKDVANYLHERFK